MPGRLYIHVGRTRGQLAGLVLLAVILWLGAGTGLAFVAGFGAVRHLLVQVDWRWFLACLGGLAAAYVGYLAAYRGLVELEGGPDFTRRQLTATVAAGFGGFLARGGSSLDEQAMEAAGAGKREAEVRVFGLQALEHVPIAFAGCAAGILLLVEGADGHPPSDFLWPWALAPPLGAVLAFWLATRYRDRLRDASGWRGKLGIVLDAIWLLPDLARAGTGERLAFLGIGLFWAGDVFAVWSAMAAFGFRMGVPALIIGYLIGYVVSRRSAPIGGAGLIDTFLPLTLWDAGAPLAAAVLGTFSYRFFNMFAPMPAAFASLPTVRAIGGARRPAADEPALEPDGGRAAEPRPPRQPWERLRELLASHHLEHGWREIALFVGIGALLALAASLGVAWAAGFGRVAHLLVTPSLVWFPVALAGAFAAYLGYVLAYREVARVEQGPELELPETAALVSTGFGVFIPRGGFAVDLEALRAACISAQEARVRVLGLGALEYAVLAPAACGASLFLLVHGSAVPEALTVPWAIAVPTGFAAAFSALGLRRRLRGRDGWRTLLAQGLDAVALLRRLTVIRPAREAAALVGMGVYWTAEIFVLWATLHAFLGRGPSIPALIVGYATGYALTRRTLPLAGAGAVEAFLPFALGWVTIPLAPALVAVFAYRVYNLWLPLVPALIGLHALRRRRAGARRPP